MTSIGSRRGVRRRAATGTRADGLLGATLDSCRRVTEPLRGCQPESADAGDEALVRPLDRGVRVAGDTVGPVGQAAAGLDEVARRRCIGDRCPPLFGLVPVGRHPLDQRAGAGRRRLQRRVRDLVGDAAVDLVTEAGEHRQRARRDREGDRLGVERCEFVACPAAADDDDGVEVAAGDERADRRSPPRLDCPFALHTRVADGEVEAEPAPLDLVVEVVPRRRADTGDDADPERHRRQRVTPVGVEQTGGDQPPHDLVAGL